MAQIPQSYKGMRDHLPEAMRLRNFITDTLIGILEHYGFEPLSTPIVEYAETLEGKFGDEEKLLFRWQQSRNELALRYDQTVPLARVIAAHAGTLEFPFKRYALGPSYRGERPQRGRYREFWQLDADIVGVDSPVADGEIIAIVVECLRALGFTRARMLINHREILSGIARAAGVAEQAAAGVYRAIDKLDKIGPQGVHDELLQSGVSPAAALRVGEFITLDGSPQAVLKAMDAALQGDAAALAAVQNLREILTVVEALGIPAEAVTVAPALARGLSYYTGCVFEAVLDEPPMGSLLGGGRYDQLVGMFSKQSFPTVGFAFGIERLYDLMVELEMGPREERSIDAYVTMFDQNLQVNTLKLASELRQAGIATLTAYTPEKLGKQFKEADRKGARFALVVGPDDLAAGVVQLKNLITGDQEPIARAEIVAALHERLA